MPSNHGRPPVEYCRGTKSSQALSSRPLRNTAASPTAATRAMAVNGPMPGITCSRWQAGSAWLIATICASNCLTRSSRRRNSSPRLLGGVRAPNLPPQGAGLRCECAPNLPPCTCPDRCLQAAPLLASGGFRALNLPPQGAGLRCRCPLNLPPCTCPDRWWCRCPLNLPPQTSCMRRRRALHLPQVWVSASATRWWV